MTDLTIESIIDIHKILNQCARMQFLMKRLLKDVRELRELGIVIDIDKAPIEADDSKFFVNISQ